MTQIVTAFSFVSFEISSQTIHLLQHGYSWVSHWQLWETSALIMCVFLVFVCVCACRSLAVNVNTTHAGRAVIIVALVTTSRPGWQEPSTLDISARVRTQHNNRLHTTIHDTNPTLPRNQHFSQISLAFPWYCNVWTHLMLIADMPVIFLQLIWIQSLRIWTLLPGQSGSAFNIRLYITIKSHLCIH